MRARAVGRVIAIDTKMRHQGHEALRPEAGHAGLSLARRSGDPRRYGPMATLRLAAVERQRGVVYRMADAMAPAM